jgi:hypothetical protein
MALPWSSLFLLNKGLFGSSREPRTSKEGNVLRWSYQQRTVVVRNGVNSRKLSRLLPAPSKVMISAAHSQIFLFQSLSQRPSSAPWSEDMIAGLDCKGVLSHHSSAKSSKYIPTGRPLSALHCHKPDAPRPSYPSTRSSYTESPLLLLLPR